jgi:XRE family transcriptional regulator, fatty acid utilization regulator
MSWLVKVTPASDPDDSARRFIRGVGERVKARREAAGLTQSRLERAAGLPPTTVTRLERGERDVEVYELRLIAEVLGADLGDLITRDSPTSDQRTSDLPASDPSPRGPA